MNHALNNALAAITNYETPDDSVRLIVAKCRGLMRGYHERWKNAGYVSLSVEQTFTSPLYNPETNAQSRSFTMAGKIDLMAEYAGRTFIIDHKTTSQDITDPNAPYWRQLAIEGQVNHYFLLQWTHGVKPDGAVWDVCRKPAISPKKLTKSEVAGVVSRRVYCAARMSDETLAALQTSDRETLEMYEARVAFDCIIERPEWYFQRRPVPRMDHEILEYAGELWEHSQEMLHTRQRYAKTGKLPPRNSSACIAFGSPCAFLGVCSGHSDIESDQWRRKEHIHAELGAIDNEDQALTNSRIKCFQTCRRLEYYKYVLGLERNQDEEKESLFFGHVFHAALDAWWRCFMRSNYDGTTDTVDSGHVLDSR